jgi:hypothetical protein
MGYEFCLPSAKSRLTHAIRIFIVSDAIENWILELAAGTTRPGMKQDTIAKDATKNCGIEEG